MPGRREKSLVLLDVKCHRPTSSFRSHLFVPGILGCDGHCHDYLPSFLFPPPPGFTSSPTAPGETEQAQGERKARLPLRLASEHEAWIPSSLPSFLPSEECLTPLPSLPHLWGGSPRTGVRPRPPSRAERIYPTQSCPPGCQPARDHRRGVCPNFLPLVLPSTGWVCVRGWCVSECTRPCTCVCVCIV